MKVQHTAISTGALLVAIFVQPAGAVDNTTSTLQPLENHPYTYVPSYGHASQNPGSPKYFEPGYGYRIPGFDFRGGYDATENSYDSFYSFGRRNAGFYSDANHRYWRNVYAGPWYHPGWPANTQAGWTGW